jgi:hypothetical protein
MRRYFWGYGSVRMTVSRDQKVENSHKSDQNVEFSHILLSLAREAGMAISPELDVMERIGGRGIFSDYKALASFAKSVGKKAREDERRKHANQTESNAKGE